LCRIPSRVSHVRALEWAHQNQRMPKQAGMLRRTGRSRRGASSCPRPSRAWLAAGVVLVASARIGAAALRWHLGNGTPSAAGAVRTFPSRQVRATEVDARMRMRSAVLGPKQVSAAPTRTTCSKTAGSHAACAGLRRRRPIRRAGMPHRMARSQHGASSCPRPSRAWLAAGVVLVASARIGAAALRWHLGNGTPSAAGAVRTFPSHQVRATEVDVRMRMRSAALGPRQGSAAPTRTTCSKTAGSHAAFAGLRRRHRTHRRGTARSRGESRRGASSCPRPSRAWLAAVAIEVAGATSAVLSW